MDVASVGRHPTGPGSPAKAAARDWCVASSRGRAGRHCHRVGEAGVGVTPQAWLRAPEAGGAGPCGVIARAGGAPMRRGGRVLRGRPHAGRGVRGRQGAELTGRRVRVWKGWVLWLVRVDSWGWTRGR